MSDATQPLDPAEIPPASEEVDEATAKSLEEYDASEPTPDSDETEDGDETTEDDSEDLGGEDAEGNPI